MAKPTPAAPAPTRAWNIYKTLRVGGIPVQELLKLLANEDFFVSDWAKNLMGRPAFKTSAEPHEVSFVRIKVADLGFTEAPTTAQLLEGDRLAGRNLGLCEPEDGPHLRRALKDQPRGDWFWVGMKPITDSVVCPGVFRVERSADGEQWLSANFAFPSIRWLLVREILFRLRK